MPGSFTSLHYHIVFSTRDRRPVIAPDLRPRLWGYMGGILRDQGNTPLAVGGTADHVHILAGLTPTRALADVMREVKAGSSRWVHEALGERDFAWQEGYAAFTADFGSLDRARAYMARQAQHHREVTFQEEYRVFLDRHGIAYEERYLW